MGILLGSLGCLGLSVEFDVFGFCGTINGLVLAWMGNPDRDPE